jgi:hypothetical protein
MVMTQAASIHRHAVKSITQDDRLFANRERASSFSAEHFLDRQASKTAALLAAFRQPPGELRQHIEQSILEPCAG